MCWAMDQRQSVEEEEEEKEKSSQEIWVEAFLVLQPVESEISDRERLRNNHHPSSFVFRISTGLF